MSKVRTIILRAPGTNCDPETKFAFEQAGSSVDLAHVNELLRKKKPLSDYHIMVIPGGFTYGDDIASGRILANELRAGLTDAMREFTAQGGLILGICNGFQVLVKSGILPGDATPVTLTHNDSGRFECRWVHLKADPSSPCVFTKGIDMMYLPVAHGEGKFVADADRVKTALSYCDGAGDTSAGYPHNPNGSAANIAGICDATGRVFGLMPHPERFIRRTQHPRWTRERSDKPGDGMRIFENAVGWARRV